ncbi:MAG: response regulator transcription factor [Clostridia bacterium]|nr:response regulator transcription factor [Clostridia bacterium]
MFKILVVEDNKNLRKLMITYLKDNNYEPLEAEDGQAALEVIDANHVDLIICDVMMPNMDGYELSKELRNANYMIPILMVTAKDTIDDKREGFLSGVDDYMVKPVDMDEMILRVGVLLRRANIVNQKKLIIKDVVLSYDEYTLRKGKKEFQLPQKEFQLLYKLLSFPNKIFTRQDLMDEIWGYESESDLRTVDVHIKRLREKFEKFKEFEIVTIRGVGYKGVIKE